MKKVVKVQSHTREGSLIPEHERVIDTTNESLAEQIKRKADDKAKSSALFGEEHE